MSIKSLSILQQLSNDSRLTRSVSLNDVDTLSNLEAFANLEASDLHFKWFLLVGHEGDISIMIRIDKAFAVFELALNYFDSFTNLDLKLRIVSDSFQKCFIVKEIPFILVIVFVVKVCLICDVNLEHLYFLETWTYVFSDELVGRKLLIEESISEHHSSPQVVVLSQSFDILSLTFMFNSKWIE